LALDILQKKADDSRFADPRGANEFQDLQATPIDPLNVFRLRQDPLASPFNYLSTLIFDSLKVVLRISQIKDLQAIFQLQFMCYFYPLASNTQKAEYSARYRE
jgi:hypothetical protein